jgi:hypothetical protein
MAMSVSGASSAKIHRFKPYPSYKDSGVEWLGEIPVHWGVRKVKRLCLVRRGASPRPIDDPIYFDENGECAWVRIADVPASQRYLERTTQRLSPLGKSKSVALEPGELFVSIAATIINHFARQRNVFETGVNEFEIMINQLRANGKIHPKSQCLHPYIRFNVHVAESTNEHLPVILHKEDSIGAMDYADLTQNFIHHFEVAL